MSSTPTSPDLSGRLLGGRYRVKRLLGRGGMGSVYEAVQEDLGRSVAVKVLDPSLAVFGDQVERFRREATSAAALGHSNIVSVTDFGRAEDGEPPYLVMELLSGESLGALLERESVLAPERMAFIASQMLSALGAAHGAGIVHRDIKPDNVFITSTSAFHDLVKLLDFGIAKLGVEHGGGRLTGTGAMLGTPAYMAPEQARGGTVDLRADLYAVGATMYQALSGRLPHDAPSFPAMLFAIVEQSPESLSTLRPDLAPGLVKVVERAMAKSPDARYPSAEAMRAALAPYLPGTAGVSAPISSDAPTIAAHASGAGVPTPVLVRSQPPEALSIVKTPSVSGVASTNPPHALLPPQRSLATVIAASSVAVALICGVVAVMILKISSDNRSTSPVNTSAAQTTSANPSSTSAPSTSAIAFDPDAVVSPRPTDVSASSSASAPGRPKMVSTGSAAVSASVRVPEPTARLVGTGDVTPPPAVGKLYGGDHGHKSGNDFSECKDCDWTSWGAAMDAEEPAITACYKASVHEPPLHEHPYFWVYLNGDGTVKDIEVREQSTPNLDRCLGVIIRRHPLSKKTSVPGNYRVGFAGECATFECK
ncbi:hypothetical protein BH09MYX1_BH09MYX1_42070 [soil metagenome]